MRLSTHRAGAASRQKAASDDPDNRAFIPCAFQGVPTQTDTERLAHTDTHRQTPTCSAESDEVDFEFGPVNQVLPVGETSVMSALAIRCQDKITEALYPIEQLITEAQMGQPGWTGGERTATPLCGGQGSTLAPSLSREQPRRMWRSPLTEECLKRLRTSTTVQTRIRAPRCPILPAYDAGRRGPKKRPARRADPTYVASWMQCASQDAELAGALGLHK